jgi:hypothetical protein
MLKVPVMVVGEQSEGGLVDRGATGSTQQSAPGKVVAKVFDLASDHLVEGVTRIAEAIAPSLNSAMSGLTKISVQEVSIGCAINASGGVVVAGVGAEASLTITFKIG